MDQKQHDVADLNRLVCSMTRDIEPMLCAEVCSSLRFCCVFFHIWCSDLRLPYAPSFAQVALGCDTKLHDSSMQVWS